MPETWNVSSSKPASGTSRDSTRSGEPANVTVTPRARSASADRERRPDVPGCSAGRDHAHELASDAVIDRDVKEDADPGEQDDEADEPP